MTIRKGTVFAGIRTPDTHNEIVDIYVDGNRKMVACEQYGATLANQNVQRKVVFYYSELESMIRRKMVYIILERR